MKFHTYEFMKIQNYGIIKEWEEWLLKIWIEKSKN